MCASRQAIVVTGAGSGAGDAKSIVHSSEPADIGAADVPRGRMLQQPRTGSQKYSSSVRPSSRGRRFLRQYQSNCSASRSLLVIAAHYRPVAQSVPAWWAQEDSGYAVRQRDLGFVGNRTPVSMLPVALMKSWWWCENWADLGAR
ncbi:hypothetical protein RGQ21_01260 [Kitasatospora aureofaciens]|nr:hypothetical protein RGQ21_01260 [Kitasatospora aureofaciens]